MISVIVLNWNRPSDTLKCLESLHTGSLEDVEVIVVDNGSTDDSVSRIRSSYPAVTLIGNETNLGYAEGNNIGIRYALGKQTDFIFVLNNDTRIGAGALQTLQHAAVQNPDTAFFGPKILDSDKPDMVQSMGIRLDYYWQSHHIHQGNSGGDGSQTMYEADCISGAAVFIRADSLKKIGLLDPDFYLYREDIEWCLRARRCGYKIRCVPDARIWHRSHQVRENDLPRITYYMTRNSLLLFRKHHVGLLRQAGLTLRFLRTALSWTIHPRWKHKRQERDALLKGLNDYFHGHYGRGYA